MLELLLPPVISEDGKKHIIQHKYRPGVKSLTMPYLNIWWEIAVTFVPRWFAPNLLTLCSFLTSIMAFLVFAYCDPSFSGTVESPSLYIYLAVSIFAYQTLDAIDGKHARNTLNSSPLGQLFDHGCDAILVGMLVSINGACCFHNSPGTLLFLVIASQIVFYALNWRARHTGVFDFGKFSIDETFLLGISLYITSAVKGPSFFADNSIWGVQPQFVIMCGLALRIVHDCTKAAREVSKYYAKQSAEKKRFYDERFYELGNVMVFHLSLVCWNTVDIVPVNPTLFITTVSVTFAHLAHRLIICDVAQQKSRKIQYIVIPFVVIGILAVMEWRSGRTMVGGLSMRDLRVLVGVAMYSGYVMGAYAIRCMLDISNVLDIYIFRYNEPKAVAKED